MPGELKIKVCGMRDPGNIRELVRFTPDLMGFIFYPGSKRFVDHPDPEVFCGIPAGIMTVGVYVNESVETIKQHVTDLGLDLVQLHGDETPDACSDLAGSGIAVIKAFGIGDSIDVGHLQKYSQSCKYFLFDTGSATFGGTGRKFDWTVLDQYTISKPFFLSGGIGPEDIPSIQAIDHPVLAGIDINSRFETEPGLKDIEKVKEFIQTIRRK
jgi:phosphoribosylanthranilate isomerase